MTVSNAPVALPVGEISVPVTIWMICGTGPYSGSSIRLNTSAMATGDTASGISTSTVTTPDSAPANRWIR